MPTKKVDAPLTVRSAMAHNPEIKAVARRFAALALAQMRQEGTLSVRQGEQLRRGLATAGEALGWTGRTAASDNPVAEVSGDVLKLAKGGAKAMEKDLAAELVRKKTEISQITKMAASALAMSEDENAKYPTEITYYFTARDATGELITKTDTLTPENSEEALKASSTIEKNMPSREKLNGLMVIDLKEKQKQLAIMTKTLPEFVKTTHDLLRDVIANLQ
jgi:hypothetical protein